MRPGPAIPSLALGLDLASTKTASKAAGDAGRFDYDAAMQLVERPITLKVDLNDGRSFVGKFRVGDTFAGVKKFLQDNHNIDYESVTLQFGKQVLYDPLSINDVPDLIVAKDPVIQGIFQLPEAPPPDAADELIQSVLKAPIMLPEEPPRSREFEMGDEWAVKTYKQGTPAGKKKGKSKYEVAPLDEPKKTRTCLLL